MGTIVIQDRYGILMCDNRPGHSLQGLLYQHDPFLRNYCMSLRTTGIALARTEREVAA